MNWLAVRVDSKSNNSVVLICRGGRPISNVLFLIKLNYLIVKKSV